MLPANPILRTLADVGPSSCSPCCTNNGLYFVLEFDRHLLRKHTPRDARDHHNNRLDVHQYPASLTLLETIPTHNERICRGFRPLFLGPKLPVGASQDFPLYGAVYSCLPRSTQAKDNVAHTKAKSQNRDFYEFAMILPFSLHPEGWRAWAFKTLLFPSCRIFLKEGLLSKHELEG